MQLMSERLGAFVSDLEYQDLPGGVAEKAKLCLLDAVGCLAGAHQSSLAPIAARYVEGLRGDTGPNQRPRSIFLDPATRAAAYAVMINALDYDDIFWKGHPGATVNATLVSMARSMDLSGVQAVLGIVAGYEVSCRVAMSLGHTAPRKTVHGHGTWQTFGAAAAAAKLLELDANQTAHALAIAAANAPVPSVMKTVYGNEPTFAKNNFGSAAHAGVTAAYQARAGMTGPLDVFEGDTGFWKMAGADKHDLSRLARHLGEQYEIADVGFKAFSCCRIIQACAQAVQSAFKEEGNSDPAEDIDLILAAVPEIACEPPFSRSAPMTMAGAQFSVPHAIIATLEAIPPGPDWFMQDTLDRLAKHPLIDKILLRPRRAAAYHGADVTLMFPDGRSASRSVQIANGDAASPLSEAFLADKFTRLASPLLGKDGAATVLGAVTSLERNGEMGKFINAVEGALVL